MLAAFVDPIELIASGAYLSILTRCATFRQPQLPHELSVDQPIATFVIQQLDVIAPAQQAIFIPQLQFIFRSPTIWPVLAISRFPTTLLALVAISKFQLGVHVQHQLQAFS